MGSKIRQSCFILHDARHQAQPASTAGRSRIVDKKQLHIYQTLLIIPPSPPRCCCERRPTMLAHPGSISPEVYRIHVGVVDSLLLDTGNRLKTRPGPEQDVGSVAREPFATCCRAGPGTSMALPDQGSQIVISYHKSCDTCWTRSLAHSRCCWIRRSSPTLSSAQH